GEPAPAVRRAALVRRDTRGHSSAGGSSARRGGARDVPFWTVSAAGTRYGFLTEDLPSRAGVLSHVAGKILSRTPDRPSPRVDGVRGRTRHEQQSRRCGAGAD